MAAAYVSDPEVQMAAAIAASLTDFTRDDFDPTLLPQYKRDLHSKEAAFHAAVRP